MKELNVTVPDMSDFKLSIMSKKEGETHFEVWAKDSNWKSLTERWVINNLTEAEMRHVYEALKEYFE
jgi:hypothetical protein